ncbi:MAG: nuclear transport factor 2 family protein [Burkholderiaceae bacterium]|nr:nuclear transport factor 2 family protein [Burkholderiaceae bacterium]
MVNAREFAAEVFRSVDVKDVGQFMNYLSEDSTFVFGNSEPVVGHTAIFGYVKDFLGMVRKTIHDIFDVWQINEVIITRMSVTYTRHDGRRASYPCVTVWEMTDGRIADYRIYIDNSGLFADQGKAE